MASLRFPSSFPLNQRPPLLGGRRSSFARRAKLHATGGAGANAVVISVIILYNTI